VPRIDELRVLRDRARVRVEVAELMEAQARRRFSDDSTQFVEWKMAMESAGEARRSFNEAEAQYRKALAANCA